MDFAKLTDPGFSKTINRKGIVLLNFCTVWSSPCTPQHSMIEQLKKIYREKIRIWSIDIDEHHRLGALFQITSIPTVILMKNGHEVERFVGLQNIQVLSATIENNL